MWFCCFEYEAAKVCAGNSTERFIGCQGGHIAPRNDIVWLGWIGTKLFMHVKGNLYFISKLLFRVSYCFVDEL